MYRPNVLPATGVSSIVLFGLVVPPQVFYGLILVSAGLVVFRFSRLLIKEIFD